MTATDFWSPALAPGAVPSIPLWDEDVELCRSQLMLLGDRAPLTCSLDADHLHDQFDSRHCSGLARWTDEEAAEARVAWWAQFDAVCVDCTVLVRSAAGPRCAVCSRARFVGDDIETTEEAA
ncbi:hypothetical protein [Streptacidiphilus cavernicola]|uniref:Uncharacterized protein n=1 Tax=Streptacidiphilus cavernicola TaxID=3342716 RepID=A0ABV6W479_9ACTN